jgi:4-hydroxythreonine-4-phosphate dehydrogenase
LRRKREIGDEEVRRIAPAIALAKKSGINASGPFSADTVFHRARQGEFDALLSMYHDQGIGPLKTLDFERVVNVTLGLSFVRTSPGHGTAYDIAWQGKASPASLFQAFDLALRLAKNRKSSNG